MSPPSRLTRLATLPPRRGHIQRLAYIKMATNKDITKCAWLL